MPFVDADIIEPFVHSAIAKKLKADSDLFDVHEAQASFYIRDTTGEDIPALIADRPDWVDSIAAALIEYYAMPAVSGMRESEQKLIQARYDRAIKEMAKYRTTPTLAKNDFVNSGKYVEEAW